MSLRQRLGKLARKDGGLLHLAGSSMAVRGFGVISGFVMHVVLSRTLGPSGAGVFYLALTLMMAAGVVGKFGLDTALMRFAGTAFEQGDLARVQALYRQAAALCALCSAGAAVLLYLGADWLAAAVFDSAGLGPVIRVLAIAVFPFSLMWVQSGILKSVGRPVAATLVESAMLPTLVAAVLVGFALRGGLTPVVAALTYLGATVVVSLLGVLLFRAGPGAAAPAGAGPKMPGLAAAALPLALIDMMNFLMAWSTFPLLGSVASDAEVGMFNAAHRLSIQFSILLVVFGSIMAPRFAARHAAGDLLGLERLAARTTSLMTLLALPVGVLFLLWPEVVALIFGREFEAASEILRVLTVGQLINLMTGPAGYVLVMSGHQRTMRNILLGTLIIVLPLTWALAREYGAVGAAAATTFGLTMQNLLALIAVHRHLGIVGLPLYPRLFRKPRVDDGSS